MTFPSEWLIEATATTPSAKHRSEYVIPQRCADAVISSCKSMMALVMLGVVTTIYRDRDARSNARTDTRHRQPAHPQRKRRLRSNRPARNKSISAKKL